MKSKILTFINSLFSAFTDSFCENLKDQFQLPVYLENLLNSLLETNRYMKGYLDF